MRIGFMGAISRDLAQPVQIVMRSSWECRPIYCLWGAKAGSVNEIDHCTFDLGGAFGRAVAAPDEAAVALFETGAFEEAAVVAEETGTAENFALAARSLNAAAYLRE